MENCEIIKKVQDQLNDPAIEEVVVPPGTYELYETITVPPKKRVVGYGATLNMHTAPALDFKNPLHPHPCDGFTICSPSDADACSTKSKDWENHDG
jgi:hypothetical protein